MAQRRHSVIITESMAGRRLDKAVQALLPELGIRGCRRLWQENAVRVDGRPRPCGYRVAAGEQICLEVPETPHRPDATGEDAPRLLLERGELSFLYKPAGLHSTALAGSSSPSLEGLLPRLFPDGAPLPLLFTRLDRGTSGLVAAGSPAAASRWRALEDAGRCEKRYLAVLEGRLEAPVTVRRALDTARRTTTKVLDGPGDAIRTTFLQPLAALTPQEGARLFPGCPCGPLTLAGCVIHKGARHQIRAHAASMGHPLEGDGPYGAKGYFSFLLHHGTVVLDAVPILVCVPIWLQYMSDTVRSAALTWLRRGADTLEKPLPCFDNTVYRSETVR